jgi:hypothetical protein
LEFVEALGTDGLRTATDAARAVATPRQMVADPSVACADSFSIGSRQDTKYLISSGQDGVADLGADSTIHIGMETGGDLNKAWLGGERAYFDYRVPDQFTAAVSRPVASIVASNASEFAVVVSDAAGGTPQLLVLRKSDNTWHKAPGFGPSFVRGFGSFVAIAETQPKTAQNPISAGAGEWRRSEAASGPSIEARLSNLPYVLPGRLDLFDVATERTYSIPTSQGDSEVLLVDSNTVYYRVSNRLYSAAVNPGGIGPAQLLSTSESVRDVHWAFVKH